MKTEIGPGILSTIFFILLLIFSLTSFISGFGGIFLILVLVILALSISILMTNKITKSSNSLKAKIYFGFILNLLIFVLIIFFWFLGSNSFKDEFGIALIFLLWIFGACSIIGFIIGLILSIKRKKRKDFKYNLTPSFWIIHILLALFMILFFYNNLIMYSAITSKSNTLCSLTLSLSSNSYLFHNSFNPTCQMRVAIAKISEIDCGKLNGDYCKKCYIWVAVAKKDIKICINNADSTSEVLKYNDYCSTAISQLEEQEQYTYNILKNPQHPDIIYAIKSTPELGVYYNSLQTAKYVPLLKEIVQKGSLESKKESLNILMTWASGKSLEEEKIILREEILPLIKNQSELKSYVDKINQIQNAKILPSYSSSISTS